MTHRPNTLESTSSRTKSEDILSAGRAVFLRLGYAATSMEGIAQAAGVSKQTVYNHFGSKEELFAAIVRKRCEKIKEMLNLPAAENAANESPEETLTRLACASLDVLLAAETLDFYRLILTESRRRPELGRFFYETGPKHSAEALAAYLRHLEKQGILHFDDAQVAAEQFFSLVMSHIQVRRLLGVNQPMSLQKRRQHVQSAVKIFLNGCRDQT